MMCYGVMTVIMCLLFISTRVPLFSVETPPHWFLQSCLDTWFSQLHIIFHAFAWLSLARTGLRETLLALGKMTRTGIDKQSKGKSIHAKTSTCPCGSCAPNQVTVLECFGLVVVPPDVCQLSGGTRRERFGHRNTSGMPQTNLLLEILRWSFDELNIVGSNAIVSALGCP